MLSGTTIDLSELASGLVLDEDGIWRPREDLDHTVSFPHDGHEACFQIEDNSFWFAHRNACITAALGRERVQGVLLDVGGGNGAVSQALEESQIETILLEPGPEGARNARRRGLRNVVCAKLEDAGFQPEAFGAAGLFDVAEHVVDDDRLLRDVHRVLRPRGVLCITVPAYGWLWSAEDDVAGHHRRYTLARLRALLERCGFTVRFETYFFAPLTLPIFVVRSLPHRVRQRSAPSVESGAAKQHVPSPILRRVVDAMLAPELQWISAGRSIPFGTSCLAVAVRT
ncbi:MAG: hypothetical protein JWP01_2319 [Myxococcales bacterium]|nr:hypothetical protein [Myxococcales bacterium]